MAGSKNFRYIETSLVKQFAMHECALNACVKHPLFQNDVVVGKASRVSNQSEVKQKINDFFGTDHECIKQMFNVSWIIIHGYSLFWDHILWPIYSIVLDHILWLDECIAHSLAN